MSDVPFPDVSKLIQGVLRHDRKLNTYKLALIRALNDTALHFAALQGRGHGVAVPLRRLAEEWVGYYWPFMDSEMPILQGPRVQRDGVLRQDLAFRPLLTELKQRWRQLPFGSDRPTDGMLLVSELRGGLRLAGDEAELRTLYQQTLRTITRCVQQPIAYAGTSGDPYRVFSRQRRLSEWPSDVVPLPGSRLDDLCVVIPDAIWEGFKYASVFIDALCIHEWSLFTEHVRQLRPGVTRGSVYQTLTERPDRRRPLTWERNQLDLLLLEGQSLHCVWTGRALSVGGYDLDHLIPVATTPINELWNLVPADPAFNQQVKRDRLPDWAWQELLPQRLEHTYQRYDGSPALHTPLSLGAELRFRSEQRANTAQLAEAVTALMYAVAEARNTPRFGRSP